MMHFLLHFVMHLFISSKPHRRALHSNNYLPDKGIRDITERWAGMPRSMQGAEHHPESYSCMLHRTGQCSGAADLPGPVRLAILVPTQLLLLPHPPARIDTAGISRPNHHKLPTASDTRAAVTVQGSTT